MQSVFDAAWLEVTKNQPQHLLSKAQFIEFASNVESLLIQDLNQEGFSVKQDLEIKKRLQNSMNDLGDPSISKQYAFSLLEYFLLDLKKIDWQIMRTNSKLSTLQHLDTKDSKVNSLWKLHEASDASDNDYDDDDIESLMDLRSKSPSIYDEPENVTNFYLRDLLNEVFRHHTKISTSFAKSEMLLLAVDQQSKADIDWLRVLAKRNKKISVSIMELKDEYKRITKDLKIVKTEMDITDENIDVLLAKKNAIESIVSNPKTGGKQNGFSLKDSKRSIDLGNVNDTRLGDTKGQEMGKCEQRGEVKLGRKDMYLDQELEEFSHKSELQKSELQKLELQVNLKLNSKLDSKFKNVSTIKDTTTVSFEKNNLRDMATKHETSINDQTIILFSILIMILSVYYKYMEW